MPEVWSLFRQYQPACLRDGPSPCTFDSFFSSSSFFFSSSRACVAWSAAAVGGNGAEAITWRKLTFLGEITFTKYLISSRRQERRAHRRLSTYRVENALARRFLHRSAKTSQLRAGRDAVFRLCLFVSTSLPDGSRACCTPRRFEQACTIRCEILPEHIQQIDRYISKTALKDALLSSSLYACSCI